MDFHILGGVAVHGLTVQGEGESTQLVHGVDDVIGPVEVPAVCLGAVPQDVERAPFPGKPVDAHIAVHGPPFGHVMYLHAASVHGVDRGIRVVRVGVVPSVGGVEVLDGFAVHGEPCARGGLDAGGGGTGYAGVRVDGADDAAGVGRCGDTQQHGDGQRPRQQDRCFSVHVSSIMSCAACWNEEGACPNQYGHAPCGHLGRIVPPSVMSGQAACCPRGLRRLLRASPQPPNASRADSPATPPMAIPVVASGLALTFTVSSGTRASP